MIHLLFLLAATLFHIIGAASATNNGNITIIENATIYTLNPDKPWAQALALDSNGTILAVGTLEEIHGTYHDVASTTISLKGNLLLPGFQDAHLHAVEAGINSAICYVYETPLKYLADWFQEAECINGGLFGGQGWIVGAGVDVAVLLGFLDDSSMDYPITILDAAYPDTPVLILDNIGHGAVANTAAMKIVGYDVLTQDPPGGKIVTDPDTGALTGIVLENAQQKLRDAAFPPTDANIDLAYTSLMTALQTLAENGITSVSDAGGFWKQAQTEAWARAEQNGVLTVRANNALYIYPDQPLEEQLPQLLQRYTNNATQLVRFNQAKIYVDGILELATGAVYEPYDAALGLPEGEEYGFEYFGNAATLNNVSKTLIDNGFQLHFHCTGDRGAGLALDAIEAAGSNNGPHRLTHLFLVNETDRPRFHSLNVIADFQLALSAVDLEYADFLLDFLGEERTAQLLPALEVYKTNATLTLSSDWDADHLSPFSKLWTVLNRPDGRSFPDLATVLPMLTLNPSKLLHTNTGSIEVGKFADLVALDRNIFEMDVGDISTAQIALTMFNGKVIYDPNGMAGNSIGTVTPSPAGCKSADMMSSSRCISSGLYLWGKHVTVFAAIATIILSL